MKPQAQKHDRHQECRGQGYANIVSGFMGGMAGCAMIGQSIINVSLWGAHTSIYTYGRRIFAVPGGFSQRLVGIYPYGSPGCHYDYGGIHQLSTGIQSVTLKTSVNKAILLC